jgi:hypothetical protein
MARAAQPALPKRRKKTVNDLAVKGQWVLSLSFEDEHGRTKDLGSFTCAESWVKNSQLNELGHWLRQCTRDGLRKFFL